MRTLISGFTMLELMIVVAIIAMLVGLSAPSLTQAMHSGKEAVSVQKLRQLHLALSMYRADQESSQDFGTIGDMGIPDWQKSRSALQPYGATSELWQSPCYEHPEVHSGNPPEMQYWGADDPQFEVYSATYELNLIMFSDIHCTLPKKNLLNQFHTKRGLGVLLSGQIVRRTAPGMHFFPQWWAPPI